tara:strand:+ start:3496 stop:4563 length:1068 start_codon:yes stop_codon:yes gene_type:complete
MKKKVAFITGITGQDGSYLAELLLQKNYIVHGLKRRSSSFNTSRIDHIYSDPQNKTNNFYLHHGDMTDSFSITNLIKKINPDEIYNLAAQSHVAVSFEAPEYTANVDALGTLRVLEAVRTLEKRKKIKIYQASTSELYGASIEIPQNENTAFNPQSPYGVAKLYSYWICKNYRDAYGMFICNGILFNHESKRRGETFITRKITQGIAAICKNKKKSIYVGNLDALRDWGHAKDYVNMQWLMLQQKKPEDYVIATGKQCSVREFIERCFEYIGVKLKWSGKGDKEIATIISSKKSIKNLKIGSIVVRVDKRYYRPLEVSNLLGDASKAKKELGWKPKITIDKMIKEMIDHDIKILK